ncbi:MAG TPA: dienelactone hydrolase family protein [Candidatus Limnocylindrales bacterium]|nr:dienelactone hydrolase family protein [Candidatus Limnocylindrales bacterium]
MPPAKPAPSEGLMAETIPLVGHGGDLIAAYLARPLGPGPYPGVVVIHHMPGWDEWSKEVTRKFAAHGYVAICPHLHYREGPNASPDDAAAAARAAGGVPDERLLGDAEGAIRYLRSLPSSNGKVGVIGYCSGGRQAFLTACSLPVDAAVDCYGAFVIAPPPENIPLKVKPVIGLVDKLACPLLGLFGAEDKYPTPDEVKQLESALATHNKTYAFHTYEGAGHAFFATDRPSYRPEAAVDGWRRIWEWFGRYLSD